MSLLVDNIKQTLCQMITDRGFQFDPDEISKSSWKVWRNDENPFYPSEMFIEIFQDQIASGGKVRQNEIISRCDEHNNPNLYFIIVLPEKQNITVQRSVHRHFPSIEIFIACELKFNVTRHVLVPSHRRIPKGSPEYQTLIAKYGDKNIFPNIHVSDPQSRYYAMKPGDLCEIQRKNFRQTDLFYRIVKE